MASNPVPMIIVLALGAGALGFPDALGALLDIPKRSPLTDIAICFLAIAVVTTQALGAMLLARFIRKAAAARAGAGDAHAPGASTPAPRTDSFARMTLVVSLGVALLVSACLLVVSGAGPGGLGLLYFVAADVARKMKSPVVAVLVTAAAVLPCARILFRVFRKEDHSHAGAATASRSTAGGRAGRFASMSKAASFTGTAAFLLLAVFGGLYARRGSLAGVAAVVGTVLVAGFAFTRRAHNAASAGGRAAPPPATDTGRVGGKLAPYLAVVSFVALLCCLLLTTYAPLQSGPDGAKYP